MKETLRDKKKKKTVLYVCTLREGESLKVFAMHQIKNMCTVRPFVPIMYYVSQSLIPIKIMKTQATSNLL